MLLSPFDSVTVKEFPACVLKVFTSSVKEKLDKQWSLVIKKSKKQNCFFIIGLHFYFHYFKCDLIPLSTLYQGVFTTLHHYTIWQRTSPGHFCFLLKCYNCGVIEVVKVKPTINVAIYYLDSLVISIDSGHIWLYCKKSLWLMQHMKMKADPKK